MNTTVVILLAVLTVAIAVALIFYYRWQLSERLHSRFGPEYDRTVNQLGDRQKAESELRRRVSGWVPFRPELWELFNRC